MTTNTPERARLSPTTFGDSKAAIVLADLINQELDRDYRKGRAIGRAIGRIYAELTRRVRYILKGEDCLDRTFMLQRVLEWALDATTELHSSGRISETLSTYHKNVLITYTRNA